MQDFCTIVTDIQIQWRNTYSPCGRLVCHVVRKLLNSYSHLWDTDSVKFYIDENDILSLLTSILAFVAFLILAILTGIGWNLVFLWGMIQFLSRVMVSCGHIITMVFFCMCYNCSDNICLASVLINREYYIKLWYNCEKTHVKQHSLKHSLNKNGVCLGT